MDAHSLPINPEPLALPFSLSRGLIRSASNNKLGVKAGTLMTQEDKEKGVIGWNTAWFWFKSGQGNDFISLISTRSH